MQERYPLLTLVFAFAAVCAIWSVPVRAEEGHQSLTSASVDEQQGCVDKDRFGNARVRADSPMLRVGAGPAVAGGRRGTFALSTGPYFFSDSLVRDVVKGWSVRAETTVSNHISLDTGLIFASGSGQIDAGRLGFPQLGNLNVDATIITLSAMLNVRSELAFTRGGTSGIYAGAGAGVVFTNVSVEVSSGSATGSSSGESRGLGWQLFAGLRLGRTMFVEGRYLNGRQDANTGYSLGLGAAIGF